MTPIIRDAATADIDEMLPLLAQLFDIEADFKFDAQTQRRGLELMLDGCGKHRTVKVALDGDRIIGMCTAQTRISTAQGKISATVEDLVVNHGYRKKGIGALLLTAIEDWAKMMGMGSIQLLADKNNHAGLGFYANRNWKGTALICLVKSL